VSAALTRLRRRSEGPLDDLSARELEVLRLLAGAFSAREIAAALHMSPNTLKTHTRRIFRKLGVSTRADAVRRAEEADLLRT
jgi:LuxR family maltose regulon positive regulatory protein